MTRGDISFRISYLQKSVVIDEVCFVLFAACMNMTFQVEEKVSHDNRYRFTLFARQTCRASGEIRNTKCPFKELKKPPAFVLVR